ncbi:DUF481 domain-containing protein [Nitratiruptor sp. SB155-2]|uniref:DUF481 domain-containing protein n=1 Tax=Nitratiruptor sp. (strain SB155-2) TaxID=387092 RepID=UPI0001586F43|nr:DUF481 domain-containing protein [Nitratiruptor sp. SB155-2]BAF69270.1 conserved hypothetical protein [Nitratiruptor sp. SB155-2]
MRKFLILPCICIALFAKTDQKIEFGYFATTGNSDSSSVSAGYSLQTYWTKSIKFDLKADMLYSRKDGETDNERYRLYSDLFFNYDKRLFTFMKFGFLRNRFEGYDAQYSVNPGIGYKLSINKKHEVNVLGGYEYRYNDLTTNQKQDFHYIKAEIDYTYHITTKNSLTTNFYTIKNLQKNQDYESKLDAALNLHIVDQLGLKFSYEIKYDNLPPAGKKKTDTLTKLSLTYAF